MLLATIITALATVVLAYVTRRYVKLTYDMLIEMKAAKNPLVFIKFIKRMEGHNMTDIDMIISNKGLSPAKYINLRTSYGTNFIRHEIIKGNVEYKSFKLNELPIFINGIPYLPPGEDVKENIGKFQNEDLRGNPYVRIDYSYKTETGETIYRDCMPDLRISPAGE